jgi:hypothetical protein
VLAALRQAGAATRALSLLEAYRARFPQGELAPESLLLEAEAERARHRPAEALQVLARLTPAQVQRLMGEVQVLTGELQSQLDDCTGAERSFAEALDAGAEGLLAERARFGGARCAVQRSAPEAPALLQRYLEAFPQGRFAAEARGLLENP